MRHLSPNHQSKSILLVDDSKSDYEIAVHAFKEAALHIPMRWCRSGQEALDFLQETDESKAEFPSLILLDLHMPALDGCQTLQHIKANGNLKSIPVIMLTSSTDERDITACYQMGANTYMQKPHDLSGYVEAVKRLKAYWFDTAILPKTVRTR